MGVKEKGKGANEKGKKAKKGNNEIGDSDVRQHDVHLFS